MVTLAKKSHSSLRTRSLSLLCAATCALSSVALVAPAQASSSASPAAGHAVTQNVLAQNNTAQNNTAQNNTAPNNTASKNTAPNNTAQNDPQELKIVETQNVGGALQEYAYETVVWDVDAVSDDTVLSGQFIIDPLYGNSTVRVDRAEGLNAQLDGTTLTVSQRVDQLESGEMYLVEMVEFSPDGLPVATHVVRIDTGYTVGGTDDTVTTDTPELLDPSSSSMITSFLAMLKSMFGITL